MKKIEKKKLVLAKETVRRLTSNELTMAGGVEDEMPNTSSVFIVCFTSLRCSANEW